MHPMLPTATSGQLAQDSKVYYEFSYILDWQIKDLVLQTYLFKFGKVVIVHIG